MVNIYITDSEREATVRNVPRTRSGGRRSERERVHGNLARPHPGIPPRASPTEAQPHPGHTPGITERGGCPGWVQRGDARGWTDPPPCPGYLLKHIG